MPYRLLDIQAHRFLTAREVLAESDDERPARFPDWDEADQALEDFEYAAILRSEEPREVAIVEVDDRDHVVRFTEAV